MDGPLVFLTSTSESAPSGRNARIIARTSMFRRSPQSMLASGTFDVFSVRSEWEEREARQKLSSQGSLSVRSASSGAATLQRAINIPRVLGPQDISIEGLLSTATSRINQDLTTTLRKQPSRVRDILRCKHWAAAALAFGSYRMTPEVYSAIEYLEHKVQFGNSLAQPQQVGLLKYGVALSELQKSLRDTERRMQPSVLAASHILAICEMLSDPVSSDYLKFTNGIVTLSNLQANKGDPSTRFHIHSYAEGTILVEALLTKRNDAMLERPWSQIIITAGDQGRLSSEDASTFAESVDLIFPRQSLTDSYLMSQMSEKGRMLLVERARKLHSGLKCSIRNDLPQVTRSKYACPPDATLDERIAVMLGLEDFACQAAGGPEHVSELAPTNNCSFYADAICSMWQFTENIMKDDSRSHPR